MLSLIITYWNRLKNTVTKRREQMADFNVKDELLAMELPEMLNKIRQAVKQANKGAGEFFPAR